MKKILLILLATSVLIISGCGNKTKKEDIKEEEKQNVYLNTNITLEQTVANIKFSNISLLIEEGISKFKFNAENTTSDAIIIESLKAVFKDNKGNVIYTQDCYLEALAKNESTTSSFEIDVDLTEATSLEFQVS